MKRIPVPVKLLVTALTMVSLHLSCGSESSGTNDEYIPRRRVRLPAGETEGTTLNGNSCPSGTALTYHNFGQAFLAQHCTGCHSRSLKEDHRGGAPTKANFDEEPDAAIWRNGIFKVMFRKPATMPPNADVPETELALMREWLRCGTP